MDAKIWDWLVKVGLAVALAVASAFGWMVRRQVKRIDELEKHSVNRDEYNQTVNSLRNQINQSHNDIKREIHETRKDTTERLDAIMLHLSRDKD